MWLLCLCGLMMVVCMLWLICKVCVLGLCFIGCLMCSGCIWRNWMLCCCMWGSGLVCV